MMKRMGLALVALAVSAALWGCGSGGGTTTPASFSISPPAAALPLGGSIQFQTSSPATFTVASGGGTITAGGLYTAPRVPGSYQVIATNGSNGQTATATVTVSTSPVAISIAPQTATVLPGATQSFNATVTGVTDTRVSYSVQEANGGTVNSSTGLYTAPTTPGTYHVIATSLLDTSQHAVATVTVPNVTVALTPQTTTLGPGGTQPFTATVSGTTNTAVTYSVQEANGGTINPSTGLYTAPTLPGTYHIVATSSAVASSSATATVTVTPSTGIQVHISPTTSTVAQGATQNFTATVTGSSNSLVNFSVQEPGGGTINASTGVYVAPNAPGTYHIVATSRADTSAKDIATVTVPPVALTVPSQNISVGVGQTATISPSVTGTSNIAVTGQVQEGTSGGSVSQGTGNTLIYTAPGTAGVYHVIVTSAADPTQTQTITITVSQGPTGTGVVVVQ